MPKKSIRSIMNKLLTFVAILSFITVYVPDLASAAAITSRSVTISNPQSNATGVTYAFAFTIPSSTAVKSIGFQFCDTASSTCNTPGFFAAGSAALASQPTGLGSGGSWANTNATNSIRIFNASNAGTTAGAVAVSFSGVTNPTLANSTFFIRITTYSDASWTPGNAIDTGTVVASTSGLITVNATVDEALTFTLSSATVTLGPLSVPGPITTSAASTGTTTLVASTNAQSGYAITYSSPNSLQTAGATSVLPSYSSSASQPGVAAGFGINLVQNTTPVVGAAPSGGVGSATAPYNAANAFTFVGGNVATPIASTSNAPSLPTTYTVSYVANIVATTPAGAYSTTFSYVATPKF